MRSDVGFHPALAQGFYGGLGATLAQLAFSVLGRPKSAAPETNPNTIQGQPMSYDILGGSIGYDPSLIGDDPDALLEALAVSGMPDLLVSGDGSSEIIGALAAQGNAKAKQVLAKIAQRNAGAVVQRDLDRRRRYPLGVVPTSVTAGTQSQIPASPQNLFRPERLVIPSDIAFDSGVVDIKVGNVSQFVQSAEVPGALFSEVAINTGVNFDTAEIGN
ncbi:MAG TPA: hypothetical protein VNN80_12115, partial [Polyangiaceae bacterium]|nr:hypothetical protein [Polyangiaceae bacterium]